MSAASAFPTIEVPSGRSRYERSYETVLDQQRNQALPPNATRFRSRSIGEMDAQGNRTNRDHQHQDLNHNWFSSGAQPNAGPHTQADTGTITTTPIMVRQQTTASDWPALPSSRRP